MREAYSQSNVWQPKNQKVGHHIPTHSYSMHDYNEGGMRQVYTWYDSQENGPRSTTALESLSPLADMVERYDIDPDRVQELALAMDPSFTRRAVVSGMIVVASLISVVMFNMAKLESLAQENSVQSPEKEPGSPLHNFDLSKAIAHK